MVYHHAWPRAEIIIYIRDRHNIVVLWSVPGNKKRQKCVQCPLIRKFLRNNTVSKIWRPMHPYILMIQNLFSMQFIAYE